MEKINITKNGLMMMLINAVCVKLFLTFPRGMVVNAGNSAWIQSIYISLAAMIIYYITYKLYQKCGKNDILSLAENVGGHIFKVVTGVLVCVILVANICMTVRIFPESIKLYLLPTTPTEFILLFLGAAAVIGTYNGIEVLGRLHTLFIPFAGIIMALFFLFLLPYCKTENIMPFWGMGTYNIFVKGFNWISIFADILLLNLLLPYCKSTQTAFKCGFYAILWGGICTTVISLIYCMIYPYPISSEFIMPVYQLTRLVRVGDFFQRAESIFEFVWSIATIMYISTYICAVCLVWQKTFNLRYHRPLIIPVATILVAMSFLPQSIIVMLESDQMIKNIIYPIAFLLPIILPAIYIGKLKRKNI